MLTTNIKGRFKNISQHNFLIYSIDNHNSNQIATFRYLFPLIDMYNVLAYMYIVITDGFSCLESLFMLLHTVMLFSCTH